MHLLLSVCVRCVSVCVYVHACVCVCVYVCVCGVCFLSLRFFSPLFFLTVYYRQ